MKRIMDESTRLYQLYTDADTLKTNLQIQLRVVRSMQQQSALEIEKIEGAISQVFSIQEQLQTLFNEQVAKKNEEPFSD